MTSIACRLRPVLPQDVTTFFHHQKDPVAAAMAAFPPRERAAHDAHWSRILTDPTVVARTILDDADGQVAGNVVSFVEADGRRFVGYWLGSTFWGRGLATTALRLFVQEVGERPLYAQVAEHNRASRTVLRRCGFVQTGMHTFEEDGGKITELEFTLR
jgi:RimJ/RimL family protein N-acetyltransferase